MQDCFVWKKNYTIHNSLKKLVKITPPRGDLAIRMTNRGLAMQAPKPGAVHPMVDYLENRYPLSDGGEGTILRIRPQSAQGVTPGLVWFHGGGFVLRAAPHHYRLACQYALETGCQVLMVDYRLMPRFTHPCQMEDAFAAWNWITANCESLQLDPERIAIGGDGAGAALAAGCTLKIRDAGWHRPCFQMLLYPILDFCSFGNSRTYFADSPVWNMENSDKMWEHYMYSPYIADAQYATPARTADYHGLPPAYVEVVMQSCVTSEGVNYAGNLEYFGCKWYPVQNAVHGFDAVAESPITRECVSRRIQALKEAFAK